MKIKNLLTLALMSTSICSIAHADPVTAITNLGNYMCKAAQAGVIVSVGGAGISYAVHSHEKAMACVKAAIFAGILGFGAPGIISLISGFSH